MLYLVCKDRLRNALGVSKHRRRVSKRRRKNGVTAYTKEEHQKSFCSAVKSGMILLRKEERRRVYSIAKRRMPKKNARRAFVMLYLMRKNRLRIALGGRKQHWEEANTRYMQLVV